MTRPQHEADPLRWVGLLPPTKAAYAIPPDPAPDPPTARRRAAKRRSAPQPQSQSQPAVRVPGPVGPGPAVGPPFGYESDATERRARAPLSAVMHLVRREIGMSPPTLRSLCTEEGRYNVPRVRAVANRWRTDRNSRSIECGFCDEIEYQMIADRAVGKDARMR